MWQELYMPLKSEENMIEKLKEMKLKFLELTALIGDPAVIADMDRWKTLCKEHADMEDIMAKYDEYLKTESDITSAEELKKTETDSEMIKLANEEISEKKHKLAEIEEELKVLLLPKDENDEKNVIVEIRAGAGGDEAGLFGMELKRMYTLWAEKHRFSVEEIDGNYTDAGGVKECTFMINGKNVYSLMKFESGVHRVQRVPVTESQGRVHTSTATVAVLPEQTEVNIDINEKDLDIDIYRSGGAGGQHVNKTESAIRITHKPTGIVVTCQDERSQIKNREKAMNVLKSKLYDYYKSQADAEYADRRRGQIGGGERCEKIRTYNFPQNRVTDHRINYTIYSLDNFMNGDIDDMISALELAERQRLLMSKNYSY